MGCGGSVHTSAAEQRLEELLRRSDERASAAEHRLEELLRRSEEREARLIGLLEAQATGRANFAPDESAYAHSNTAAAASRMGQQLQPPSSVIQSLLDPKLVLRKELQQLQVLEAPTCDLNALLSRQDIVNTLTKDTEKQGSALEEAAADARVEGLLSKGQLLLEVSTRIDAATILALSEDTNINEVPGPIVRKIMASLLNAAAASAEYDRLSHRLVCILTAASRLVIVLHRCVEKDNSSLPKDLVEQWRLALSEVRRLSRKWTNHTHIQNLLGLQLTLVESGLLSMPDPTAKGKAAESTVKLAFGVAKSVMTMKVDDTVFRELTNLAKLAIEKGGRYLAYSCFSELRIVEEARALACLALRVGKDREIRLMVSNLFARLQRCGMESVRWESMAAFGTMLADMLVCFDGLQELSPDTVRYICLGLGEDNTKRAGGFGNTDPASANFNNEQPEFSGLLGLLSLGDDKNERGDPTAIGTALLADCASRLTSHGRVDTWMEELHNILCAQCDQLVEIVKMKLDSVLQKLVSNVCDPLKEGKKTEQGEKKTKNASVFWRGAKPPTDACKKKRMQASFGEVPNHQQMLAALDELMQGLQLAREIGEKLTKLVDRALQLLTWLHTAISTVSTAVNVAQQAVDTAENIAQHVGLEQSNDSGPSLRKGCASCGKHGDQVRSKAGQAKASFVSLTGYIETGQAAVRELNERTKLVTLRVDELSDALQLLRDTCTGADLKQKLVTVDLEKLKLLLIKSMDEVHEKQNETSLGRPNVAESSLEMKIVSAIQGTKSELAELVRQMTSNSLKERRCADQLPKLPCIDAHMDGLRDMALELKQEAKKELEQVADKYKNAIKNAIQMPEQIEESCGALVMPMFEVAKSWWKGRTAKKASQLWRARMYAAMHVLRVLAKMRAHCLGADSSLSKVLSALERGIVRRQAFESSGAVSTILLQGEVAAAELSVELWRVKLQDTVRSYKEAVTEVKDEIESTMHVEIELLEANSDESAIDDPFLEQQRVVLQRAARAKMEVFYHNVRAIEKASGESMKFLREMNEKLAKIDSKLDAIQEALLNIDVKLDCVLNDTRMILSNQEAASRQQAEHHQAILKKMHRDVGFYLYFAIQPPPVVAGSLANQMWYRQQIDNFEKELKAKQAECFGKRAYPISLNDATSSLVSSDLDKGKVRILVWCAPGYGWEAPSDVETIGLDALLKAKLPEVIIVVLKYGARKAAKLLHQRAARGTVIIYVQADMLGDDGRKVFRLIAPVAWKLHEEGAKLDDIVDRLRTECEKWFQDFQRSMVGYFSSSSFKTLLWNPEESAQSEWVIKDAADMLKSRYSNLANRRADLARQKVLSNDISLVDDLKCELQEGTCIVYALRARDNVQTSRCMSIALAACSSFVLARGKFDAVFEIETQNDLDAITAVVTSRDWSADHHILLWAHIQDSEDGLADAEFGLRGSWTDSMSKAMIDLVLSCNKARLIITSDASKKWGDAHAITDIVQQIYQGRCGSYSDDSACATTLDEFRKIITLAPTVDQTTCCPHHEEIKIFSKVRRHKGQVGGVREGSTMSGIGGDSDFEPCDLIALFSGKLDALQKALKDSLPGSRPIAAMYSDMDDDGCIALVVRISISDVAYLHELRDKVLGGFFGLQFREQLSKVVKVELPHVQIDKFETMVDLTHFASKYEKSVFSLDSLTPHQIQKLHECEGTGDRHLEAPAGAGKTFVALHRMLEELAEQNHNGMWVLNKSETYVLFVARNPALAYFVAQWLSKRFMDPTDMEQALSQLHTLVEPFAVGPRKCCLREGQITFVSVQPSEQRPYALFVVDEAHHVYRDSTKRSDVEKHVTRGTTRRLLLSDVSQSEVDSIEWPTYNSQPIQKVQLTEVVRCSQRIVAGAAAFQLGQNKRETKSNHAASGPPLRSYLFDPPPGESDLMACYTEKIMQAFSDVVKEFPGLGLHNRLAFIVRSPQMVFDLLPLLSTALKDAYPNRNFEIVDAQKASAWVGGTVRVRTEWLVLDHIANFDGLERLIVLCIGLDSVLEDPNSDVRETRSMLYRGLTRAHMMVCVINELLRGGWLEFLTRCRLNAEKESFDREQEMGRINYDAVDVVINSALDAAIVRKQLHKDALNVIKENVTSQIRDKKLSADNADALEEAVSKAAEEWRQDEEQMMQTLMEQAKVLDFTITGDENMLAKTCCRAVALWRRTAGSSGDSAQNQAALAALKELVPDKLITHAATQSKDRLELLQKEAEALGKYVISPKLSQIPPVRLQKACDEAICEWVDLLRQARELLLQPTVEGGQTGGQELADKLDSTRVPAVIALEAVSQQKSDREKLIRLMAQGFRMVLEAAMVEAEVLNTDNLLKLARQVATERAKIDVSVGGHDSTEYIAKVVVRKFCVPGGIERVACEAKTKLSAREVSHLRERTTDAVSHGKEALHVIVQQEFGKWMEKREKVNVAVQTKIRNLPASGLKWLQTDNITGQVLKNSDLAEALTRKSEFKQEEWDAFGIQELRMDNHIASSGGSHFRPAESKNGIRLSPIVDFAIDAVAGGAEIGASVDKAMRDAQLNAAVCAAAASLGQRLASKQVEELKEQLGAQNPSTGQNPSADDDALRQQAEEAIKKSSQTVQEIINAIKKKTEKLSLTEKEMEDIHWRVTAAVGAGASLDIAIQNALPQQQCIWDTKQNSATFGTGDLKFDPLGQVGGVDVHAITHTYAHKHSI